MLFDNICPANPVRQTGFEGEVGQIFEVDDGGFLLLVNHWWTDSLGTVELVKLSEEGDSLWSIPIEMPYEFDRCFDREKLDNGDIVLIGSSYTQGGLFFSRFFDSCQSEVNLVNGEQSHIDSLCAARVGSVVTVDDHVPNDSVILL